MNDGVFISQSNYAKELLKKFGMENCKRPATPVETGLKLFEDIGTEFVDNTFYRQLVGSLIFI
jgi:hypothetical protein